MRGVSRYIKQFGRIGFALGPSEDRGFAIWAGYDIEGVSGDLTDLDLINVDGWSETELAARGVKSFVQVSPTDAEMYAKLGIERK